MSSDKKNPADRLRVGKVDFINTLPIFYPLESGAVGHDFLIVDGTPTVLNALLAAAELDLGLVSSLEYARRFEEYVLLPDLSISCRSQVCSVLLLSTVPLKELAVKEIILTPKSETSIALLKLLFSKRFEVEPRYRVADYHSSGPGWPDGASAVLAIGDDALRLQKSPEVRIALDLGAAWHEWTGCSFVFAVWALRREALANRDGLVHQAHTTLLEAREYGLRHLEEIAATAGQCSWFSKGECVQYLQTIEYDLDADKQAGLRLFFDMLHEVGELSQRVPLHFLR
ncbi:MAG: menaquinone biosynthesis protein [Deltaproteobacteria bacterium]|nr:MAG: menaquinone biosynthesis protein [Deltaproteobacteria bacterium]